MPIFYNNQATTTITYTNTDGTNMADGYYYGYDTGTAATWTSWQSAIGTASQVTWQSNVTYDYVWDSWQATPFVPTDRVRAVPRPARPARRRHSGERDAAYLNAAEKAQALLEEVLTEEEAKLLMIGQLIVKGSKGGEYRIGINGQAGNVHAISGPRAGRRLCAHPSAPVPNADAWLAQKLMIETDEDAFLAIANAS